MVIGSNKGESLLVLFQQGLGKVPSLMQGNQIFTRPLDSISSWHCRSSPAFAHFRAAPAFIWELQVLRHGLSGDASLLSMVAGGVEVRG